MASQLRFIQGVPSAMDSYQRYRQADQQDAISNANLESAELRNSEARRQVRLQKVVDDAIGGAMNGAGGTIQAQPGGAAPVQAQPLPAPPHTVAPQPGGAGAVDMQELPPPQAQPQQAQPQQGSQVGGPAPQLSGQPTGSARERLRAVRSRTIDALGNAPGGREQALRMMMADAEAEEKVMRQTFEFAKTDPQQAMAYAQSMGVQLDPTMQKVLTNQGAVQNWAKAMDAAKAAYPDQHQAGKRYQYAQEYFRGLSTGDIAGAVNRAPAPTDTPRYQPTLTEVTGQDGRPVKAWVDPNTQTINPTGWGGAKPTPHYLNGADNTLYTDQGGKAVPVLGPDGQPFKGSAGLRGVNAGRTTSVAPNPQTIQMRAMSWADRQQDAAGRKIFDTPEKSALAVQAYSRLVSGDYQGYAELIRQANPEKVREPGFLERLFSSAKQDVAQPAPASPSASTGGNFQTGGVPQTYSEGGVTGTFTGEFEGNSPVYQTPDGQRFVVE